MQQAPDSKTSRKPRSGYLPTLDGWRAIAVVLVLCAHTTHWPHALDVLRIPLNSYGYLGVDVFFALSGLLICHRLLEEETLCGRISLKGFYVRRSFRIFPPAFFYLLVVAVLGLLRVLPTAWHTWVSALLFVRNYAGVVAGDNAQNGYTAHFWSLGVEEHFYLLLPAVLVFAPRFRKPLLLILTVLAFAWIALYLHLAPLDQRTISWYRRSDLHLAGLLFPAWLTLVLASPAVRKKAGKVLHPAMVPLLLALLLAAKYVDKALHPGMTTAQKVQRYDPAPPVNSKEVEAAIAASPIGRADIPPGSRPTFARPMEFGRPATALTFLVPVLMPFLILSTLLHPAAPISRLLESAPMRYVGRLSYSIYLWQQLFWELDSRGWPIHVVQRWPPLALLLTFAAALFSFYLIERPLIRLGHRLAPPATPGHRDTPVSPRTLLGDSASGQA